MRSSTPARSLFVLVLALVALGLALPACGGSSGKMPPKPDPENPDDPEPPEDAVQVTRVKPTQLESEVRTKLTVFGSGFGRSGADVQVQLVAKAGTPFLGGTSASLDVDAQVQSDTGLIITTVAAGVSGAAAKAYVRVVRPDGVSGSSSDSIDILPPRATALTPSSTSRAADGVFTLTGEGFGPFKGDVTVTFTARSGTPFLWGTSDRIAVRARVHAATEIRGTFPAAGLQDSTDVDTVEVAFESGARAGLVMDAKPYLVWHAAGKKTASDGLAGDNLGHRVAVSGDIAILGAPGCDAGGTDAGAAYVFERRGAAWLQVAKLQHPAPRADHRFGLSVGTDGARAIVGARDRLGGSAHVFVRGAAGWTHEQELSGSNANFGDAFGAGVAISGTTALVGDPQEDEGGTEAGAAYVFVLADGSWDEQQKILADDAGRGEQFGHAVALSGDTALIGARWNLLDISVVTGGTLAGTGSAYVFERADGVWEQQARLLPRFIDARADDSFGASVALAGDTAVVGAPDDDVNGAAAGAAYVFVRDDATWSPQAKLLADDGAAGDRFGQAVGVHGDTVIVGAPDEDDRGTGAGAAYVFLRRSAAWSEVRKLLARGGASGDDFGCSVAVGVGTAVVGARSESAAGTNAGAAYIY